MEQEIYLTSNGVRTGPFSSKDVQQRLVAGKLPPGTLAWYAGMDGWKPVSQVLYAAEHSPAKAAADTAASWQLITAFILTTLALCVLAVAGVRMLSAGWRATWETGSAFAAQFAILIMAFLFATPGLILACFHRDAAGRPHWPKITAISLNGLCLLISGLLFAVGIAARANVVLQASIPTSISRSAPGVTRPQEPLTIAPSSYSEKDDMAARRAWSERVWLKAYLSNPKRDRQWDEMGTNLIRASITIATTRSDTSAEMALLNKDIEQLSNNSCQDPILLMLAARHANEVITARGFLERASNACTRVTYPGATRFSLFLDLGNELASFPKTGGLIADVDQAAYEALNDSLKDGSYSAADQGILENVLLDGRGNRFFERNGNKVFDLLASHPGTAPWLVHRIRGQSYINTAWAARGGGYANTVTEQGWKDFRENLDLATKELTKAWELNPKNPAAATAMIGVAMGKDGDTATEMRLWFDRAIKARCDYMPAYNNYTWGLRPRWGGSHGTMLEFARQCLATKRFDTDVPYRVMRAVLDIDSEWDGDIADLYSREDVKQLLDQMFAGYVAEPSRRYQRNWFLTMQAATRYIARDWPGCQEILQRSDFKLDQDACSQWVNNLDLMSEKVAAMNSPASSSVTEFEAAYKAQDFDRARKALERSLTESGANPRATEYARHRLAELDMLRRFSARDTSSLLPDDAFHGWYIGHGDWSSQPVGTLSIKTDHDRFSIWPRSQFTGDFEMEFTFAVTESSNDAFQTGVLLGQLDSHNGNWYALRFKRNSFESDVMTFAKGYRGPKVSKPITFLPENQVRITCSKGRMNVWFNQVLILENHQLPKELTSLNRLQIGMGGYHDSNRTTVVYRNLHIRQFKG